MSKNIQVRDVPDRLHRKLVRRARERGQTLTDYVEEILEREVARPPREEVVERISSRSAVDLGRPAAEILGEERRNRDSP